MLKRELCCYIHFHVFKPDLETVKKVCVGGGGDGKRLK